MPTELADDATQTRRRWSPRNLVHRAPGFVFNGIVIALCFVMLVAASRPGWTKPWGFVAGLVVIGMAVVWIVRAGLFVWTERRWSGWLAITPVIAIVVFALLTTDTTLQARWDLAQSRFDDARADLPTTLRDDPIVYEPAYRVGSYLVSGISQDARMIRFDLGGRCGGFGPCADGFVYVASPALDRDELQRAYGWTTLIELGDGWFAYADER